MKSGAAKITARLAGAIAYANGDKGSGRERTPRAAGTGNALATLSAESGSPERLKDLPVFLAHHRIGRRAVAMKRSALIDFKRLEGCWGEGSDTASKPPYARVLLITELISTVCTVTLKAARAHYGAGWDLKLTANFEVAGPIPPRGSGAATWIVVSASFRSDRNKTALS